MSASEPETPLRVVFERRLQREKAARKEAERLLERKSRELFESNVALVRSHEELEARVADRTRELASMNEKLQAANREALAASRAKSEFLANMSHEIRTPLNGVLGSLQVLMDGGWTDARAFASTAFESARVLLHILDDILDLSKIEAGRLEPRPEPTDLHELLTQTVNLFMDSARAKRLTLRQRIDVGVPQFVSVDPTRLRQILGNLLGNAIKFTENGSIALEVTSVSAAGTSPRIEFSVADTGVGIAADRLHAVFEKFTQAESSVTRRFGGTGLGLTLSRELVRLLGGEIAVESVEGVGSRFWFRLDLPVVATPATSSTEWCADSRLRGLRVLLVEDGDVNRRIASHVLKRFGCVVFEAVDGVRAVEAARENDFDLILMDCQMPNMSGYEATRRIRDPATGARDPHVLIVAMTANALAGDREACLAVGMDDYIAKPFEVRGVWSVISRLMAARESTRPKS